MAYSGIDDNELDTRIARLEKMRASGVLEQTVDGNTTKFRTIGELNAEIRSMRRELQYRSGVRAPHPFAREIF